MKLSIITEKGIEKTCAKEVKEFLEVDTKIFDAHLSFDFSLNKKNLENLFRYSMLAQTPRRIISQIMEFEFTDENDLKKKVKEHLKNDNTNYWFDNGVKFHVRCFHHNTELVSVAIEPEIGALILDDFPNLKVSMEEQDIKVLIYINNNKAIIGIDLTGEDLSKRHYKLINSNKSIRANIAYHLIREVNFKEGEILLDPNSRTAEIVIESALYISGMHNYYESIFRISNLKLFKDIDTDKIIDSIKSNAKKKLAIIKKKKNIFAYSDLIIDMNAGKSNAKVAGVLDLIEFSKVGLDWVDTKFDKEIVDKIVTIIASESKHIKLNQVRKTYTEFLHQVDYILKKGGKAGILIQKPEGFLDTMAQKQKALKLVRSNKIVVGKLEYYYLIISK